MMFEGTATYYRDFRPPVPRCAAETIVDLAPDLGVLLDLGTGTGQVPQALGSAVRDLIVGVEPDGEMLDTARTCLAGRSFDAEIRLIRGAAETVDLSDVPEVDVATACRAFHWMDQPLVMAKVRGQLRPGGIFAIMGDGSLWRDDLPWAVTVTDVVKKYLGPERRAGGATFEHHSVPYADVLCSGGFADVQVVRHRYERVWTPERVLGYLYSTSFSARPLYGDRLPAFEADLLETMGRMTADGPLVEDVTFELIVGRR